MNEKPLPDHAASRVSVDKETKYIYSNVITAVFASVVLGVVVDAEEIVDKTVTDALIVRLDALGYLHAMHTLGDTDEFNDLVDEFVKDSKPWPQVLSVLCHVALCYFNGAEGLVHQRDEVRRRIDDEARTGQSKADLLKAVLDKLVGTITEPLAAAADKTTLN